MNKGGFSWKRLTGISNAKSKISRTIGVPLTKSGRQQKLGRIASGGGCLLWVGIFALIVLAASVLLALDQNSIVVNNRCSQFVDCLNQNQGAIMAVLTLVYVATTVLIAFLSLRATKLSQKNIDTLVDLEKNRVRPYVVFNVSSSTTTKTTHAFLKNVGLTSAHEVSVHSQPALMRVVGNDSQESALTGQTIRLLSPGEHLTDVLGHSPSFHRLHPETLFDVRVDYKDADGTDYTEKFQIDLAFLRKRLYVGERSIEDELSEISSTLKAIVDHLESREVRNELP